MGTPIILSLYLNPHETSMACFIATNSAPKNCTFYCFLSLCIPNDASDNDEETESQAGSMSDFIICMIRIHKSSQNDHFSSWFGALSGIASLTSPLKSVQSASWKTLMSISG